MICVLHVDDSAEDRTLTSLSLKRVSDEVSLIGVDGGGAALELLHNGTEVDCIISDYQMPGMNGMELLQNIRDLGIDKPFVLLTGQGNESVAVQALREGADDYFTKEIGFANYNRLFNTIHNVVDKYRQKQKRKEAEEKAAIFKTISDKAHFGNAITDTNGEIIYTNQAFARTHGFTRAELLEMNLSDLQVGDTSVLEELKKNSLLDAVELWHRTRDGDVATLLINASIVADEENNPAYISLNTIDITQRKKDEEASKSNKERLRDLLDHVNDIIYTHDLDGNFTSVNHSIKKVFGYSEKEIIGKNLRDIVHPRYCQLIFKEIEKERLGRRFRRNSEILLYDNRGNTKYVEVNFRLVRKPDSTEEILGIARDISDKRQAIRRIKEAKEQYRDLVEKAGIAILIDTSEGGFEYFNEKFSDIFGYSKEEIIEMSISDLVHPEDFGFVNNYHQLRMRGEKSPNRYEFRGVRKNGDTIYLEVDAVPLIRDGEIAGTRSYLWDITDRKLAEKEAHKNKVYFETLIENAPEAIVIQKPDGSISKTNYEFEKTFGFSKEEALGRKVDDLITPEDYLKESKMLSQMAFEEGRIYAETKRKTKDENLIDVSILGAPIQIENKVHGHYSIFRDITKKKQIEVELERYRQGLEKIVANRTAELDLINKELEESREQYKLLAENVSDNIFILDLNTRRYSYSSPSIFQITGFAPEEIKNKYMRELFSRESYLKAKRMILREVRSYRDNAAPTRESYIAELQHLTRNGSYTWVEVTGKIMLDRYGNPDRILCSMRDIQERKRNQEIIRRTEDKYKKIIDTSPLSIIICEVTGRIIHVNPSAEKMFGRNLRAMQLMYYDELTWPEDMGLEDLAYNACLEGKEDSYTLEKRYVTAKGKSFWANLSVTVIRDIDGNPLNFIAMIENINKRKKAERKLEISRKKYKELVDLLPQTVFETDLNGNITFVNEGGLETFGYTQEMINEGANAKDIIVPEHHDQVMLNFKKILKGEPSRGNRYNAIRKNGERFPLLLYSVAIYEKGIPVGIRGVGVDISSHENAQEKINESNRKFTSIFENTSDAIFIIDAADHKIIRRNQIADKLLAAGRFKTSNGSMIRIRKRLLKVDFSDELLAKLDDKGSLIEENINIDSDDSSTALIFTLSKINMDGIDVILMIVKAGSYDLVGENIK